MEKLTVGGVSSVLGTDGGSDAGDVVLQVLDVKPLGEGKKRARLGAPQECGAGQRRATGVYFRAHLAGKREAIRPCHPR